MLTLIAAPAKVSTAGGLILSKSTAAFDQVAAEGDIITVTWETGNVFPYVDDLATNLWIPLTRVWDAGDGKGGQIFYCPRSKGAYAGNVVTVRFSGAGAEFVDIYLGRLSMDGDYMVCTSEGLALLATSATAFTIPAVSGPADFLVGLMKAFSSVALLQTATPAYPFGQTDDNTAAASRLFLSPSSIAAGSVSGSGTLSAAANFITFSAAFTDVNPVQKAAAYVPSWRTGASVGNCVKIPGAALFDTGLWTENGSSLSTAQTFAAFSGGTISTKGMRAGAVTLVAGAVLIVMGQGHTNGSGQETFGYGDIQREYPGWIRLKDNTLPLVQNVEFDGSGNPAATHSYSGLVADVTSGRNRALKLGGVGRATDASDISEPYWLDLADNTWHHSATATGGYRWAIYDTTSGLIWGYKGTAGSIQVYDPVADTVNTFTGKSSITTGGVGEWFTAWDSVQRIGLLLGRNTGNAWIIDTSSTSNDYSTVTTTGAPTAGTWSACLYDPVDQRFAIYVGSNTWYFLKKISGTWTWSNQTFGGDTVDAAQAAGTYGRAALINTAGGLRGYLVVNSYTSRAFFFIPTSATLPPAILAQPGSMVTTAGETIFLQIVATQSPTYQWQDNRSGSFANCSDGSGATTSTYHSAALAAADSGRKYRCQVTANGQTVTSSEATITVRTTTVGTLGDFSRLLRIQGWFN